MFGCTACESNIEVRTEASNLGLCKSFCKRSVQDLNLGVLPMAFVAAVSRQCVPRWVQAVPGVPTHGIAPEGLAHLQVALAAMVHFIELSTVMGITPRPLLRDWVCHVLEEALQLAGAMATHDLTFIHEDRVTQVQHDQDQYELQHAALVTELTAFCRKVSGLPLLIRFHHS